MSYAKQLKKTEAGGYLMSLTTKVKQMALNLTDLEVKVEEATNNEPWGPHGSAMAGASLLCSMSLRRSVAGKHVCALVNRAAQHPFLVQLWRTSQVCVPPSPGCISGGMTFPIYADRIGVNAMPLLAPDGRFILTQSGQDVAICNFLSPPYTRPPTSALRESGSFGGCLIHRLFMYLSESTSQQAGHERGGAMRPRVAHLSGVR